MNLWCLLLLLCVGFNPAKAQGLALPKGKALLTVSGAISNQNAGSLAVLDQKLLEDVGVVEIITATPFGDGHSVWRGPPLKMLLDRLEATGSTIQASALDQHTISIPRAIIDHFDPIVAFHKNGRPMQIREKGPLWIIFDWDGNSAISSDVDRYSVWQLRALHVR